MLWRNLGSAGVAGLIKALKSDDDDLRWRAAWALGQIGPAAKQAVPELQALLPDLNWHVREAAAKAIPLIDPTAKLKAPPGVQPSVEKEAVF